MTAAAAVGWDLGGAHLKVASLDSRGAVQRVLQLPCALWQGPDQLRRALNEALPAFGAAPVHAVTMTGEMVDYFPSRDAGVTRLLALIQEHLPSDHLKIFSAGQGFLVAHEAAASAASVASANWMASARLVASRVGSALFIDIGSTTTDLVPVSQGEVRSTGRNDAERLVSRELVYTGVVRTPVMALAEAAPFGGDTVPLIPEFFATAADVYRVLGRLPEHADLHPAADGGEKTVTASARRLARMIGHDLEDAPLDGWRQLALWLARAQCRHLDRACDRVAAHGGLADGAALVLAGVGRFLVRDLRFARGRECLEFAALFPGSAASADAISDCAPAVAVAALALSERA